MNIEQQVVSLKLSAQLKELGVKQTSLFCWSELESVPSGREYKVYYKDCYSDTNYLDIAAFTVAELMDILPLYINKDKDKNFNLNEHKPDSFYWLELAKTYSKELQWVSNYYNSIFDSKLLLFEDHICGEKLADCLAELLIKLIENGYVKV